MINAMGGAERFYQHFYINSLCPLGFVRDKGKGKLINYNYYDDNALYLAVKPFIVDSLQKQIALGLHTEECFCLGKKNTEFFNLVNDEYHFFDTITELPHPRFIVQYKRQQINEFIEGYKEKLAIRMY